MGPVRQGPAQDVPFFYMQSHLSELQSCKLILLAIFFHFHIKIVHGKIQSLNVFVSLKNCTLWVYS